MTNELTELERIILHLDYATDEDGQDAAHYLRTLEQRVKELEAKLAEVERERAQIERDLEECQKEIAGEW